MLFKKHKKSMEEPLQKQTNEICSSKNIEKNLKALCETKNLLKMKLKTEKEK